MGYALIGSLGLNALLVLAVVQQAYTSRDAGTLVENNTAAANLPVSDHTIAARREGSEAAVEAAQAPFHWRMLESDDYQQYIANLRAIRCPEQTIQDIVHADLIKLMARRFRETNYRLKVNWDGSHADYWKPDEEFAKAKLEADREIKKIQEERKESLLALLGTDADTQRRERLGLSTGNDDSNRYPFMSAQKLAAARDVWAKFKEMENEVSKKYQGNPGPEMYAEFHRLALERDAMASKTMSPYEKEEWMLRVSHVANMMRSSLNAFQPSEQEFRALYKLEYDQYLKIGPHAYMGSADPNDQAAQSLKLETQQAKDAAIRQLLGEQRYQEYAMVQNPDFKQMYRFAESSGLGTSEASQMFQIKQAFDAEAERIGANQSLSPEQRTQALTEIKNLAEKSLQETLGEKNYKSYQSRSGYWLRNLAPEPRGQ